MNLLGAKTSGDNGTSSPGEEGQGKGGPMLDLGRGGGPRIRERGGREGGRGRESIGK